MAAFRVGGWQFVVAIEYEAFSSTLGTPQQFG
jgi:hypothetical protein